MNDPQIRALLQATLTGRVLHEVDLRSCAVRADVVTVDDTFRGYEIKSAVDSRARLAKQAAAYSRIFDYCALVTEPRHLTAGLAIVPAWWGVLVVDGTLREHRAGGRNEALDPEALARMLWRIEAVDLLREHGVCGLRRASLRDVWRQTAALPLDVLRNRVRSTLVARRGRTR